jgi:hypothetical protein
MKMPPRAELRCYHFICPKCEMSDRELGHLATADEIHCLVCLIEEQRQVVLRRRHNDEAAIPMKLAYSS